MATNGRATLMEVQSPEYSSGYFFRLPISDDQSETFGFFGCMRIYPNIDGKQIYMETLFPIVSLGSNLFYRVIATCTSAVFLLRPQKHADNLCCQNCQRRKEKLFRSYLNMMPRLSCRAMSKLW